MNIAPISDPNTISPAQAATQNVRRAAMCRSYSGTAARRWRTTKAISAATAMAPRPIASAPSFGTGAKLMARTRLAIATTERMPPRLSTGSVVSLTFPGTNDSAITKATTARGNVMRNTDPHQKCSKRAPATSGPSAEMPPPNADQSAMDFVRAGPDHNAVISASVVG